MCPKINYRTMKNNDNKQPSVEGENSNAKYFSKWQKYFVAAFFVVVWVMLAFYESALLERIDAQSLFLYDKLFFVGYDVPNNILYGTDCRTSGYQYGWTKKWLKIDTDLFDKFDIPEKLRQKIFRDNLFRFLGNSEGKVERFIPLPDSQTVWSPSLLK